jgi:CheY-like chemotaxis protein
MNILIVDDDPDLVSLARRWLEREGHAVDHVGTGPAALQALALDPLPDLVLLDIMLPRIDGFALLKRIRADERLRSLPVVIVATRMSRPASSSAPTITSSSRSWNTTSSAASRGSRKSTARREVDHRDFRARLLRCALRWTKT